jgi:hypothetical protein
MRRGFHWLQAQKLLRRSGKLQLIRIGIPFKPGTAFRGRNGFCWRVLWQGYGHGLPA